MKGHKVVIFIVLITLLVVMGTILSFTYLFR